VSVIVDKFQGATVHPWAAENFQVEKYRTRYYADPMPACDLIANPHHEPVPGFTSIKGDKTFWKSATIDDQKYTMPLDWYNAGAWYTDKLTTGEVIRLEHFYADKNRDRDRSFARGHAIHRVAEATLRGEKWSEANADAHPYYAPLVAWIETNVTDVHAIEAVVFGDGYGGTGDAWLNVRGVGCYVDWKSRGVDSSHAIYEEEISQGGAYTSARYCIIPSDDRKTAVRAELPDVSFGLVLSIKPDGVEEFWYDLEPAAESFAQMHKAYVDKSNSGKTARKAKAKDPTTIVASQGRKKAATPVASVTVTPDEGPDVDITATRTAYQALTQEGRVWIGTLWDQARKGGCDFQLTKEIHTMRRARIYEGLIDLAEGDACDADAVKALCRLVTDDEALMWPTVPAGVAVGSLGATQAAAFVVACALFIAGRYAWDFTTEPPRLVEVAA